MTVFANLKSKYKTKKIQQKCQGLLSKPLDTFDFSKYLDYWKMAKKHEWPGQSWYTGTGLHYCTQIDVEKSQQVCGNIKKLKEYQDTMLYDTPVNESILNKIDEFSTVRSKITCLDGKINTAGNWHKDETCFEALRIIIPLQTSPEYCIQLDNCDPVSLKKGFAYAFNQNEYHRVVVNKACSIKRIHLILSVVTWFENTGYGWIPNQYHNKIHPLDLFSRIKF